MEILPSITVLLLLFTSCGTCLQTEQRGSIEELTEILRFFIFHGYPKLGIPALDPLRMKDVDLSSFGMFNCDFNMYGLGALLVKKNPPQVTPRRRILHYQIVVPLLNGSLHFGFNDLPVWDDDFDYDEMTQTVLTFGLENPSIEIEIEVNPNLKIGNVDVHLSIEESQATLRYNYQTIDFLRDVPDIFKKRGAALKSRAEEQMADFIQQLLEEYFRESPEMLADILQE